MSILIADQLTRQFPGSTTPAVINFSLRMEEGELVALLGASGCGKTTVLRMIAGFERPDSGSLVVYGQTMIGPEKFVEPEKRKIGIVFQDHALFPHLNVHENIRFGLKGMLVHHSKRVVEKMLEITGLAGLGGRYPHQLSGGQQQRVALARALAPEPLLILFDEPFSSIDTLLRKSLRHEIAEILEQTGTTALLVSHDIDDAFALSNRVVVMNHGVIVQEGKPVEVYRNPANKYVADFFGQANYLPVSAFDERMTGLICCSRQRVMGDELVCIRPDGIRISLQKAENSLEARVLTARFMGQYTEVTCECDLGGQTQRITIHTRETGFDANTRIGYLQIDPSVCTVVE